MNQNSMLHQVDSRVVPLTIGIVLLVTIVGVSNWLGIGILPSVFVLISFCIIGILLWIVLGSKRKTPFENEPHFHLGTYQTGKFKGRPFYLPIALIRNTLITAITGFGKSTLIRRMMECILSKQLRFLYIDFKGELSDFELIMAILRFFGLEEQVQIFDLSRPEVCLPFNPLTIFSDVEETVHSVMNVFFTEDSNEYYKMEAERFLRCALHVIDRSNCIRTFVRLLELYSNENSRAAMVMAAERNSPRGEFYIDYFKSEFNSLSARERSERFSGFISLLSPFCAEPLKRVFNPEGGPQFGLNRIFSENIPAIVRVPGESMGDLSVKIVQGIIKTLPVFIARRREQKDRKDYYLLLDEGCSYVSENLSDICKKAGSAQVKVVLTRMCDADFESVSPTLLGQMLSSFGVFICGHTTDPTTRDSMAQLSLTTEDTKLTRQVATGSETGQGTIRDVHRFNVHPSEFGKLNRGEFWVISTTLGICEKILITSDGGLI